MNYLFFNGHRCDEFGIRVSGEGTFNAPERSVTKVTVPGRNGDLVIDNGYFKNIKVSYPVSIVHDFEKNAQSARAWLLSPIGYCRLEDTYHPDSYRMAMYSGGVNFNDFVLLKAAKATLTFDCKPQRFLKSGNEWIDALAIDSITCPTSFPAKPVIRAVLSAQNASISIGSATVAVTGGAVGDEIIIDTETGITADGDGAHCSKAAVTGDISLCGTILLSSTGLSVFEIKPRWWTV